MHHGIGTMESYTMPSSVSTRGRPRGLRRALPLLALGALVAALAAPAGAGHGPFFAVLTIDPESLRGLLDQGHRPLHVDLRPPDEFRRGRLPGARSIPLPELEQRRAEIPKDRMVVLYCACSVPQVTPAYQMLRREGWRDVFVLEEGVGGWMARGYPLER